jgi:hypothetical protein
MVIYDHRLNMTLFRCRLTSTPKMSFNPVTLKYQNNGGFTVGVLKLGTKLELI